MKKTLLSTVAIIAIAGSASAADLPSIKSAPAPAPLMSWTGFYAGLNAGYNFGTNSNTVTNFWQTTNVGVVDGRGNAFTRLSSSNGALTTSGGRFSQSGFIGGGQLGYNYQYGSKVVLGIETDFQGSVTRGNQSIVPILQGAGCCSITWRFGTFSANSTQQSFLVSSVTAGIDYLGTLRARLGYLITPTILVYGTAGLAYGGAWANVSTSGAQNTYLVSSAPNYPVANQVYFGNNQTNSLLVGYSAGGGFEWSAFNNISFKFEALYWNLGDLNLATTSVAGPSLGGFRYVGISFYRANPGVSIISGNMNLNYQGVIARAGVNYHFNLGSAPVVAKF